MHDPYLYRPSRVRRERLSVKVGLTLLVLALVGSVVGVGTWSAFSSTTSNTANSFASGTVTLGDNDSSGSMFSLTNLKPGEPGSTGAKCINVDYTGSLPATVKLYGSTGGGSGLGSYLDVTVIRGTQATATFPSCTGFLPDTTEYLGTGQGAGVVYRGTLAGFPSAWASGIQYPTSAWTNGTSAVYKFEAAVQDSNAAQAKSATNVTFTWEAQNN